MMIKLVGLVLSSLPEDQLIGVCQAVDAGWRAFDSGECFDIICHKDRWPCCENRASDRTVAEGTWARMAFRCLVHLKIRSRCSGQWANTNRRELPDRRTSTLDC